MALWDVVHRCERPGSLDSAIVSASVEPNDFNAFFHQHRSLRTVVFNGAAAEQLFHRHALPAIDVGVLPPRLLRLPSTSPANARLSAAAKIAAWSVLQNASLL
jgi:hypoxanthine-DNA glycosylase